MFQQKASRRRTVRGSTDSDWCCTVRFVVILIYYCLLPKRNENYLCCAKEREKREGSCSSCSNFFQKQEHFLPSGGHEFSPPAPGSSALVLLAPAPWLYSVSTSSSTRASQIQTGNGAPHATRVAWLYYARPHPGPADPTDGRAWSRGQKSEAASRFHHFRDGKKGGRPRPSSAASASNRHEKEKAGSTKTKRGVCDVPIGGETLTITHRGHVSPTVLLFLGVG